MRFYPVLTLVGSRQTGKTTLLRHLLPEFSYVTLDLPSEAELAERDPGVFFARHPLPLIIDEIQYAPGLFRHIKAMVDADRHSMGRFILTGSQKFSLMKELSDSLAGRVGIVGLEGLSAAELQSRESFDIVHFLQRGGFPELWRLPDLPADSFYSAYMATYLERDVRQILNVGNLRDFERFVRVLATRHAHQLELTGISNAVGVNIHTAKSWLSVLEASNQIVLLEPWCGNVGKRIVKTPKLYFADSGLVCWLLGIGPASVAVSPFIGALWEGVVFAELRRLVSAAGMNRSFWYYRDNAGTEVDFLVLGEGARLIECKWTASPSPDDGRGIQKLAALAEKSANPELRNRTGAIICRPPNPYPLAGAELPTTVGGVSELAGLLAAL
jgi:predicted AAA+ superfamily ATPase